MKEQLFIQDCESCHAGSSAITDEDLTLFLKELPNWVLKVEDNVMMLERVYSFKNYKLAWAFTNKISELAEKENHHPSILLEWGKVTVTWWTHAIGGLHMNDLICAAKTDKL